MASRTFLKKSELGHVLSIAPPLRTLHERWLFPHPVYSASKYGMAMVTLGVQDELRANTIWPRKLIRTAATKLLEQDTGIPGHTQGLPPEAFADVVHTIVQRRNGSGLPR